MVCPILPATCFVGAVTWEVETKVKEAVRAAVMLPGYPPNRLFVMLELKDNFGILHI